MSKYYINGHKIVKHPLYERGLYCWMIEGDDANTHLVWTSLSQAREDLNSHDYGSKNEIYQEAK